MNALLSTDGWNSDTGAVERAFDAVPLSSCEPDAQIAEVPVHGAQVVELGDYGGAEWIGLWQEVLVLDTVASAEALFRSRLLSLACLTDGDALPQLTASEGFGGVVEHPTTTLDEGTGHVVVLSGTDEVGTRPILLAVAGRSYTEVFLDPTWATGEGLNDVGTAVVELLLERLGGSTSQVAPLDGPEPSDPEPEPPATAPSTTAAPSPTPAPPSILQQLENHVQRWAEERLEPKDLAPGASIEPLADWEPEPLSVELAALGGCGATPEGTCMVVVDPGGDQWGLIFDLQYVVQDGLVLVDGIHFASTTS